MLPNYGIAIILLTILTKVLMYPITKKGSLGTARMQELQPKIQELQAKYKSNPQKLNQEMADFYKREGYNPMSGCLPLLIQFPIFIAMYNLFNNHFDLRGASFIAGWIYDLSQPEAIYTFSQPINLVVWKMSAIRGLPIIYVASQLLYGKFTQQPQSGGQNAGQMKIMMYGMPIMFFFILYDVPSGLLVYWIVSNVITIGQQAFINKMIHKKKLAAAAAAPAPVLAPAQGPKGQGEVTARPGAILRALPVPGAAPRRACPPCSRQTIGSVGSEAVRVRISPVLGEIIWCMNSRGEPRRKRSMSRPRNSDWPAMSST